MKEPRTFDELAVALGELRIAAGAPSYAEIARRIGAARGQEPAKVTVYDCFRAGRRRIDHDLVHDIVCALGQDVDTARQWQAHAAGLNGRRSAAHVHITLAPRGDQSHAIGREELLAGLTGADVTVLSGLPGVGKTTLGSAIASGRRAMTVELRESETDRAPAGPVEVIRRMLGVLGVSSTPYDLARLRQRLEIEADGLLVVLEDAASVARLAALIVPGVRYVVTSRRDLAELSDNPALHGLRVEHVAVRVLREDDSLRLLAHLLAEEADDRDPVEIPSESSLKRIVAVSGGLPLDIAMLAGVVREHPGWTFDDLAARFENESRDARIRPVLEAATRSLEHSDAELLADAALLDREVDLQLIRDVRSDADAAIRRLTSRHLLDLDETSIQMHATVFDFVRERSFTLRPESLRRRRIERFAAAMLRRIEADDDSAARQIVTVLAIAEAARAHRLDTVCERLALAARPALTRWTLWSESLRLHELAADGRDLIDIPELALGIAHSAEKLGRFDDALVILHRVRRVAEGEALARTWSQIGNVLRWTTRFDDALTAYGNAMEIARAQSAAMIEGRALGNHADTLRIIARYAEAESEYASALRIAEGAHDDLNVEIIRSNRALLWTSTGRFEDAEAELVGILERAGAKQMLHVRMSLALLAEARGEDARARTILDAALALVSETGEYGPSADAELLRARLDARAGRYDTAIPATNEILEEALRIGSPLVATEAGNTLAEMSVSLGSQRGDRSAFERAYSSASEAIGIAEVTGDRAEIARGWMVQAEAARALGAEDMADRHAAMADDLYRELGHRLGNEDLRIAFTV